MLRGQQKALWEWAAALTLLLSHAAGGQVGEGFEEWQKKEQVSFQKFQEAKDREFVEFLKKEWRERQVFQGARQDAIPKPRVMPIAPVRALTPVTPSEETIVEERQLPDMLPPAVPEQPSAPASTVPTGEAAVEDVRSPEAPAVEKGRKATFTFFGVNLPFDYDENLASSADGPVNKEAISTCWETLSRADYPAFLIQAQRYREQMRLNDWGYYQLLDRMAEAICQGGQSQCKLLVWFMLSKSGYEVKIGYDEEEVYLLVATRNEIFDVPYFSLEGTRFYTLPPDGKVKPVKDLFTYDGHYPGADQPLDVRLAGPPLLGEAAVEKKLSFQYGGREQQIAVRLNRSMVDYLDAYPHTEYGIYFAASPSSEVGQALTSSLKPMVAGKTEREAINLLLRFVQTAFGYQTDDEQFGREKPLFVEETLFYPASDCEDRAVLFVYLVRHLLGLRVIGLDYPGHIATAVRFGGEMGGDYVVYENQHYTVCDPTYINAEVGMTMPQFSGVAPGVIGGGAQ